MSRKRKLKGYRIRVVVDIPIWEYERTKALDLAKEIARRSHSASLVIGAKVMKEGPPDNQILFDEKKKFNPSERGEK